MTADEKRTSPAGWTPFIPDTIGGIRGLRSCDGLREVISAVGIDGLPRVVLSAFDLNHGVAGRSMVALTGAGAPGDVVLWVLRKPFVPLAQEVAESCDHTNGVPGTEGVKAIMQLLASKEVA